jgi:hypothetical protein
MIIKAEHTEQGSNVRFVVTNLAGDPQKLYDRCYVQRADACENSMGCHRQAAAIAAALRLNRAHAPRPLFPLPLGRSPALSADCGGPSPKSRARVREPQRERERERSRSRRRWPRDPQRCPLMNNPG